MVMKRELHFKMNRSLSLRGHYDHHRSLSLTFKQLLLAAAAAAAAALHEVQNENKSNSESVKCYRRTESAVSVCEDPPG